MAKSGIKKMEIEISNCDCKSYCSSDIYAKKENDEYTFTDSDNCVIIDLKERIIKCNEHTLSDNYIAHF